MVASPRPVRQIFLQYRQSISICVVFSISRGKNVILTYRSALFHRLFPFHENSSRLSNNIHRYDSLQFAERYPDRTSEHTGEYPDFLFYRILSWLGYDITIAFSPQCSVSRCHRETSIPRVCVLDLRVWWNKNERSTFSLGFLFLYFSHRSRTSFFPLTFQTFLRVDCMKY